MTTKIKKPLKWLFPSTISKEYQRLLLRMIREWEDETKKIVISQLPAIVSEANKDKNTISTNIISDSEDVRNDGWVDKVKSTVSKLASKISSIIPSKKKIKEIANKVSVFNNKQWKKIVKNSLGIDLFNKEDWLSEHTKGFVEENTALITKLQQETIDDINAIVTRGIQQGKKHEDIAADILNGTKLKAGRFKKTKNRAKFIAKDQIEKLNGQLEQLRQTDLGVTRYVWNTSRDDRVRKSHSNMDTRVCVWHNSTVYIGSDNKQHPRSGIGGTEAHVGQDPGCRCNASPDFTSIKDLELIV